MKTARVPELMSITAAADKAKPERTVPDKNQQNIFKSGRMIRQSSNTEVNEPCSLLTVADGEVKGFVSTELRQLQGGRFGAHHLDVIDMYRKVFSNFIELIIILPCRVCMRTSLKLKAFLGG